MRSAASVVIVVALAASLAACSAGTTTGASDCAAAPAGASSNAVKVSGDFGAKPEVTIAFPTSTTATERTVVIAGDGEAAVRHPGADAVVDVEGGRRGDRRVHSKSFGWAAARPSTWRQIAPGVVNQTSPRSRAAAMCSRARRKWRSR